MTKKSRRENHRMIFYWLCLAFAFLLPVYGKIIPSVIALMVLNWLIDGSYIRNFRKLFHEKDRMLILSFAFLYFLYLAGMLYSRNLDYGLFDLEVKLSLLVFPLLFATSDDPGLTEKENDHLLKAFIAGCLAGVLILLVRAMINHFFYHIAYSFYYRDLSWLFHPSYIAMYFVFAVAVVAYFIFMEHLPLSGWFKATGWLIVLLFFIMIILLSSKAGIASLAVVVILVSGYVILKQRKFLTGLILFLVASAFFYAAMTYFPNAANRFAKAGAVITSRHDSILLNRDGTAERIFVWKAALKVIRDHPLAGVGTGDVKDALYDRYKESKNFIAYDQKLNPHNQYLETFVALGITGFLVLMTMLLLPAIWCLRKGYWLYFIFIVVFGMNIFVESMFETQAGVVFYAFFNIVLFRARK